jgi:uncharacterized membrane protein
MDSIWQGGATESLLHSHLPGLVTALNWLGAAVDLFAIAVMLIGVVRFLADFLRAETAGDQRVVQLDEGRMELGRYILAGLELFIVSDIIETALSLALSDLLFLGLLVAIRSAVSFFLEREMANVRSARAAHEDRQ